MKPVDRRFLRPGWLLGHALVILAVLTCLRLGWWQWDRSQDSSGTAQNLGYALLWPAFGAAFIYMWARFLSLEKTKAAEDAAADEAELAGILGGDPEPAERSAQVESDDPPHASDGPEPELAVGIVGDETIDDRQLIAYNRALAALAEEERRRGR